MINKTFVRLALCCHSQQFVVFRTQTQIWGCWKERITDYCVKNHKAVQWKNKQWSKRGLDGAGSKQEGSTVECVEPPLRGECGSLGKRETHTSGKVQNHQEHLVSVQEPVWGEDHLVLRCSSLTYAAAASHRPPAKTWTAQGWFWPTLYTTELTNYS